MNPIQLFHQWFDQEKKLSTDKIPSACCLSTIGTDGFPNARFVSLKEVTDDGFIVTGPIISRKGIEISQNNKVALTCWWPETERQVRIQGRAIKISEQLADRYFAERSRESQIVSIASEQGKDIENLETLIKRIEAIDKDSTNGELERPEDWSGYLIEPVRVEFLKFSSTRFHDRQLYELANGQWTVKQLQP
jgi:pyridoxamine 5'-phosphate oxidase